MKDEENNSENSQSDISDVGLCTINKYEISFNKMICEIMIKSYKEALKTCNYIFDNANSNYSDKLFILRAILHKEIGNKEACFFNR